MDGSPAVEGTRDEKRAAQAGGAVIGTVKADTPPGNRARAYQGLLSGLLPRGTDMGDMLLLVLLLLLYNESGDEEFLLIIAAVFLIH